MQPVPPDPRAIDYRRTFLHQHVAEWLTRYDKIMALEELRARLKEEYLEGLKKTGLSSAEKASFESQLDNCKWLWPHTFFYSRLPDVHLYRDVMLQGVESKVFSPTLTALLAQTGPPNGKRPAGLVLQARTGAGKTVASRRAFFDCFYQPTPVSPLALPEPTLFGHLPCWIDFENVDRQLHEKASLHPVVNWLCQVAGKIALAPSVAKYLELGPPLILFCDLNAVRDDRQFVAETLIDFLRKYSAHGHRCVVTYRATETDDAVLNTLKAGGVFEAYDMLPLVPQQAVSYIEAFYTHQQTVFENVLNRQPDTKESLEKARQMAVEFARRQGQQESLISTPLMMHFVSQLNASDDGQVVSLSDLFRTILFKHLRRDQKQYSTQIPESLREEQGLLRIRAALVRLATALHISSDTRLDNESVRFLLSRKVDSFLSGEFWKTNGSDSPYCQLTFDEEEILALRRFSILRRGFRPPRSSDTEAEPSLPEDLSDLGFLHDSFIYYLVGAGAVGEYRGPDDPLPPRGKGSKMSRMLRNLPDDWYEAVVELFKSRPEHWSKPAGFLAGSLDVEELRKLLAILSVQPTSSEWLNLYLQTLAGRLLVDDPVLEGIAAGVYRVAAKILQRNITQPLIVPIYDYLIGDLPIMDKD